MVRQPNVSKYGRLFLDRQGIRPIYPHYWPSIGHALRWVQAVVSVIPCNKRTFGISLVSVGRIFHHEQAWQRLINRTVPQDELPLLVETIFLDGKAAGTINQLQRSDAQVFINVMDWVRHNFLPFRGISQFIPPTFHTLLVRRWIISISHYGSVGNV